MLSNRQEKKMATLSKNEKINFAAYYTGNRRQLKRLINTGSKETDKLFYLYGTIQAAEFLASAIRMNLQTTDGNRFTLVEQTQDQFGFYS
jgi:hypothetical protein